MSRQQWALQEKMETQSKQLEEETKILREQLGSHFPFPFLSKSH
jgi:hypothetical protein